MYDIFLKEDAHKLVHGKSIVFLGDSNVRAMYKDLLCLLHGSQFITQKKLRNKTEASFYGDEIVYQTKRTNGRAYREERQALINSTRVSFYFLTRVYNDYVEDVLEKITRRSRPDVIVINSCVWDITRWGCDGVYNYKENLKLLMKKFRKLIPKCLIIWVTTPPLAAEMKGGFLVQELQFLKYSLRFHVVEANQFARKVVVENGFDVLDTHFHLQMQIHLRSPDGIHWEPKAVRYVTNLILRHISLSWDVPLPHRYESAIIDKNLEAPEITENLDIKKFDSKQNTVDLGRVNCRKAIVWEPREKLQSVVLKKESTMTEEQNKKKRRRSIQLYQVPKREEHIYVHMSKAENKARKKRIRAWLKPSLNPRLDSSQSFAPVHHDSSKKKLTKDKQDQTLPIESDNKFSSNECNFNPVSTSSCLPHSPEHDSRISIHPVIISPRQIPLPPDSPGHQQLHSSPIQSDEPRQPLFNRSNGFTFTLSPRLIPLPPDSPGIPSPDPLQMGECQLQPFNRSVHNRLPVINSPNQTSYNSYSQLDNAPPQRRVIACQTTSWPADFTNYGNRVSSHSHSVNLNQQFATYNRMFKGVSNSVAPHNFPQVIPGQTLLPRYDFVNDVMPEVYYF